jgi:hypothetical protein
MARVKGYEVSAEERLKISNSMKARYASIRERLALADEYERMISQSSEDEEDDNGETS